MVGTVKTDRFGEKFCQARTGIGRELAITKRRLKNITNFRFWVGTDIQPPEIDFRLTPNNGHSEAHAGLPLLTQSRLYDLLSKSPASEDQNDGDLVDVDV